MKAYLARLVATAAGADTAKNLVREYLQARILESLQRDGAFTAWAFLGGTALRFLHEIPRFSEDLDFSLREAGLDSGFSGHMHAIKAHFTAEGYSPTIKAKDNRIVQSAFINFPGLLHELGISIQKDEAISIKVEIDTRPPEGAGFATTVIRRHVLLNLLHHDKASLLAGKLHAVLQRHYA